jgi:hypothetical protein
VQKNHDLGTSNHGLRNQAKIPGGPVGADAEAADAKAEAGI